MIDEQSQRVEGKVKEGMDVDLVGDTLRHATSLRISELEEQVDVLKIEVVKWKGKAKDQNSTVLQADREEEVEGRNIGVPVVKSASGFDFIECFTTTFLRAHSWLNWVDEDDDEHESRHQGRQGLIKRVTLQGATGGDALIQRGDRM